MKSFDLINYNFDEQRFDIRINYPIKDGFFVFDIICIFDYFYKTKNIIYEKNDYRQCPF